MLDIRISNKWLNALTPINGYRCIIAPRQSGKTTALIDLYVKTNNSLYVVPNSMMKTHVMNQLNDMYYNHPTLLFDKKRSICVGNAIFYRSNRRDIDTIFVDEIFFLYDIKGFIEMFKKSGIGNVICVGTPNSVRNKFTVYDYFAVGNFNDYIGTRNINIFEEKGELFVI